MKFIKILVGIVIGIFAILFIIGWAFQNYDTEECKAIYREESVLKSLEVRKDEARKCSNFNVLFPSYLPKATHIATDHSFWSPGGLHGEIIYTIEPDNKNPQREQGISISENSASFPGRIFPSPIRLTARELKKEANKIRLSTGETAWFYGGYSPALYFRKDSTDVLITVLGGSSWIPDLEQELTAIAESM